MTVRSNSSPLFDRLDMDADLLASRRDRSGNVYDLFKLFDGRYCRRKTTAQGTEVALISTAYATKILRREERNEDAVKKKGLNALLKTGLVRNIDGIVCDTSKDVLLDSVERNDSRMAAMYRTKGDECYLHTVEFGREYIILFDEVDRESVEEILEFWSYEDEPLDKIIKFMFECGNMGGNLASDRA
jgi:hypothetical protein